MSLRNHQYLLPFSEIYCIKNKIGGDSATDNWAGNSGYGLETGSP
jgi:hypothetical protein